MTPLAYLERPADGTADGLLILHHGRGADEHDLLGLADVLDPARRLHVVTPAGPLRLPGWPGKHWYTVPAVGRPDPETFRASTQALAELHDDLWARTGLGARQTILGGFSMGTVMSYALGLDAARPAPAGILAFSGFVPVVDGWAADLDRHDATRAFVAHGRADPVISVQFAHSARALLDEGGFDVDYHESGGVHEIAAEHLPLAADWVARTL